MIFFLYSLHFHLFSALSANTLGHYQISLELHKHRTSVFSSVSVGQKSVSMTPIKVQRTSQK